MLDSDNDGPKVLRVMFAMEPALTCGFSLYVDGTEKYVFSVCAEDNLKELKVYN